MSRRGGDGTRLDDAARAGWLYYIAQNTQDQIAKKLGVSRQSAQRLVSLAVSEGLVKVRLDHPIARCMELSCALVDRFGLVQCDVSPSDPAAPDLVTGAAIAAAAEVERILSAPDPRIIALGTGRALKAMVDQVPHMSCPQHRIVSMLGNMMSDGSASPFNVTIRLADTVGAPHYPMPLPVYARTPEERTVLRAQESVRNTLDLCRQAMVAFVGIGSVDDKAPLILDGFVQPAEIRAIRKAGAAGEITGWIYDAAGRIMPGTLGDRITGAEITDHPDRPMLAIATGAAKVSAIHAALRGRLIQGLFTNEATAEAILARR